MHIVIFDLESTCWDKSEVQLISEIIEIGAVKIDTDTNTMVDEFQTFVKPLMNPILSKFCKTLTHIKQDDVDRSQSLTSALLKFNDFVGDSKLMSWGFYDKKQIERECFLKKIDSRLLDKLNKKNNHISLKHRFGDVFGCQPPGLNKALQMVGLKFEGTQHRGIDDAKNIARIFFEMRDKLR